MHNITAFILMAGIAVMTVLLNHKIARSAVRSGSMIYAAVSVLFLSAAFLSAAEPLKAGRDAVYSQVKNGKQIVISNVENSYYHAGTWNT
ncbi:MAG: hypothetical protein JW982_00040 [Spirochaetes bacterium]|nr:hypothetical protein [Spirochaetota bacterium]